MMHRAGLSAKAFVRPKWQCQVVGRTLASMQHPSVEVPAINGASGQYIDCMYEAWLKDPKSVHASWDAYFRTGDYARPPLLHPIHEVAPVQKTHSKAKPAVEQLVEPCPEEISVFKQFEITPGGQFQYYPKLYDLPPEKQKILKNIAVHLFIRSFQMRGHRWAKIDPLNIYQTDLDPTKVYDLSPELYGLNESDMDMHFVLPASSYIGGTEVELPLREIVRRLEKIYCSTMGLEFMYINNYEQCVWLRKQFETPGAIDISKEKKWTALKRLARASLLERFMSKKWPSEKRFGIEGCESAIPAIKAVIDQASADGVDTFIIGMPHRGRINVLANVTRQKLEDIFSRFNPSLEPTGQGSADVKYHLGTLVKRINRASQKEITMILSANPSHLEAVDPVVQGKSRARQFYRKDNNGDHVMGILLHGDAAFAAEGVVYETMDLSDLPAYTTHGTVHIVVNNQIGFTTDPAMARSSPYCTDVARVVNAPIFHVNGDDVSAVVYVAEVAAKWRQRYKKDVVIDVVGYRRHGHNEMDDPSFTHPFMYKAIEAQEPTLERYAERLISDGVIEKQDYEEYLRKYQGILDSAFEASSTHVIDREWQDAEWPEFDKSIVSDPETGVSEDTLIAVGKKFSEVPEDINVHKGLVRILANRRKMLADRRVDWALAEAMAFGSILLEGKHVRLSGEDVERGTFSHRHHVLHDQVIKKKTFVPLNHLSPDQAEYTVCNSSLCEFGILGFELGYSTENPDALIMWEAQFGDFANNAQCIIDQFISSGEAKWCRQTGVVLLLPHAYEGSGPEHSSARIERFLQLCNQDWSVVPPMQEGEKDFPLSQLEKTNMILANCTTPANYFHVLRRQLSLPFRKPLVIFTPKSLLRAAEATSSIDDMTAGTRFKRVITDPLPTDPSQVKRVLLCSGHVYYDISKAIVDAGLQQSHRIIRVEQLCPFPFDMVMEDLKHFPNAELCWVQEEHKNMGPYMHCAEAVVSIARQIRPEQPCPEVKYIGRPPAAAAATGNRVQHLNELSEILAQVVA